MKTIENINWLRKTIKGSGSSIKLVTAAGILHVSASLFFIYICKRLIDMATGVSEKNLTPYFALMILTMLLQIFFSVIRNATSSRSDIILKNHFRDMLFSAIINRNAFSDSGRHTGETTNILEEDVRILSSAMSFSLPALIVTAVQFAAAFMFLLYFEISIVWFVIAVMPVALVSGRLVTRKIREISLEIREADGKVQSCIQESLQNRILIQSMEHERSCMARLALLQSGLFRNVAKRIRITNYAGAITSAAFAAGYAVAFIWGTEGISKGTISFGTMAAMLQLVGQIQRPLVEIGRTLPVFIHASASLERMTELADGKYCRRTVFSQKKKTLFGERTGLRLENIVFSYPDGKNGEKVINGFSHDFTPGSVTAITGETGAGKSTLTRLMLGIVRPASGNIVLYDDDKEVSPDQSTLCNFIYVPQGNSMMSGTIRDNLRFGNPDADDSEMEKALKTAAAEFVFELPEGLDTECSERGGRLSEGQSQRIAIARGLLRKGNIMLFDEFSSSLDNSTQEKLMKNLISAYKGKTMIFITHRKEVTDFCDECLQI